MQGQIYFLPIFSTHSAPFPDNPCPFPRLIVLRTAWNISDQTEFSAVAPFMWFNEQRQVFLLFRERTQIENAETQSIKTFPLIATRRGILIHQKMSQYCFSNLPQLNIIGLNVNLRQCFLLKCLNFVFLFLNCQSVTQLSSAAAQLLSESTAATVLGC